MFKLVYKVTATGGYEDIKEMGFRSYAQAMDALCKWNTQEGNQKFKFLYSPLSIERCEEGDPYMFDVYKG